MCGTELAYGGPVMDEGGHSDPNSIKIYQWSVPRCVSAYGPSSTLAYSPSHISLARHCTTRSATPWYYQKREFYRLEPFSPKPPIKSKSQVLPISLHMYPTEVTYGPAVCGRELAYGTMRCMVLSSRILHLCGTERAYGATRVPGGVHTEVGDGARRHSSSGVPS
eukprot:3940305-Rhodomonas_salina.1